MTTDRVGKNGAVIIPLNLRRQFGLDEGVPVVTEAREDGVLVKAAGADPRAARYQRLIEETNRAYAALRTDPEAWEQELEERRLWEATLLDGLDDQPWNDGDDGAEKGDSDLHASWRGDLDGGVGFDPRP